MRLLPPPPPRPLLRERLRPPPPPPRLRERLRRPPPERERLRFPPPPPPPLERERLRERDFLLGTAGSVTRIHQRARPHMKRQFKRWPRKHAHSNPSRADRTLSTPFCPARHPDGARHPAPGTRPGCQQACSQAPQTWCWVSALVMAAGHSEPTRLRSLTIPRSSWVGWFRFENHFRLFFSKYFFFVSQCVMGRLIHTGLGSSSLIAHVLHSPPPPTRTAL